MEPVPPGVCGDHVSVSVGLPPVENNHPVALPSVWLRPGDFGERAVCRAGGKREEREQTRNNKGLDRRRQ